MLAVLLLLTAAVADPFDDEEAVRFSGVEADLPHLASPVTTWTGGARGGLRGLMAIEERLQALGAAPNEVVLVSAQLDWGRLAPGADGQLRFSETGLTVRSRRLSDGEIVQAGKVVDERGTYDLTDPEQRDRLCTRARAGDLGTISLHPMRATGDPNAPSDPAFLMVQGEHRTAVVDLEPGESATLVEVLAPERKRPLRVRRSLVVERGDKVLTLTEGDVLQQICLEF